MLCLEYDPYVRKKVCIFCSPCFYGVSDYIIILFRFFCFYVLREHGTVSNIEVRKRRCRALVEGGFISASLRFKEARNLLVSEPFLLLYYLLQAMSSQKNLADDYLALNQEMMSYDSETFNNFFYHFAYHNIFNLIFKIIEFRFPSIHPVCNRHFCLESQLYYEVERT